MHVTATCAGLVLSINLAVYRWLQSYTSHYRYDCIFGIITELQASPSDADEI